jgi:hypothetical protein
VGSAILHLGLMAPLLRRRQAWAYTLAAIMLANGALMLRDAFWPSHFPSLTPAVAIIPPCLAVIFFLCYPEPHRWLRGRLWLLLLLAALPSLYLVAIGGEAHRAPDGSLDFTWADTLVISGAPAIAWSVAFWRISQLGKPANLQDTWPHSLLFAAFALRAAHMTVETFLYHAAFFPFNSLDPDATFRLALDAMPLVMLGVATTRLLRARFHAPTHLRASLGISCGTLLLGAVGGLLVGPWNIVPIHWNTPANDYDFVILRPALVWLAILQPTCTPWLRNHTQAIVLGAAALGLYVVSIPAIFANVPSAYAIALGLALAAFLAWAEYAIWRLLAARTALKSLPETSLQLYLDALARSLREPRSTRIQEDLHGLRRRLGITAQQHRQLEQAARRKWLEAPGPWMPNSLVLGRYQVRSFLGEGTLGEAYRCHDILRDQEVVLKRPKVGGTATKALLAEAEALQQVHSPHVVRLLRFDHDAGGPVLVMDYLPGGSLAERTMPMKMDEVLRMTQDIVRGLEAVHAAGLVHGDIKPANILLDQEGRARVADFGIARPRASLAGETVPASPAGSLRYMAPEQLAGQRPNPRSDLRAAALVMLELLTGQPPWTHASERTLRAAIVDQPPRIPPSLPLPVRAFLGRALSVNPKRRHASATAMLRALEQLRVSLPETASDSARPQSRRQPSAGATPPPQPAPS